MRIHNTNVSHISHPHYVEMLVPRRKGQLVKLLILVPLSLLLATSIYYQFYYDSDYDSALLHHRSPRPNSAGSISAGPSAEALVGAESADDVIGSAAAAAASDDFAASNEAALQSFDGFEPPLATVSPTNNKGRPRADAGSHRMNASSASFRERLSRRHKDELQAAELGVEYQSYYNLRQRTSTERPDVAMAREKLRSFGNMSSYDDDNGNDDDDAAAANDIPSAPGSRGKHRLSKDDFASVVDVRDNQQLAMDRRLLKQQQSQITRSPNSNHDDTDDDNDSVPSDETTSNVSPSIVASVDISSNDKQQDSSSVELLREEEEADAQDVAVIPPPSDPSAPGELGRPVILKNLTKEQQMQVTVGWDNNAFNQYVSDIISLNRTLPDVRDPSCKDVKYAPVRAMPQTSVIICFHNEAWSVLLRTVHSILNRSPRRLVKEIILVDDFSNKPHLGEQLEDYVRPMKIVRIVRAKKREGLIRARLLGAQVARAPVLTFLDSHCECAEGWLEPLLARIHQDPTVVVCPVIDVISDKTFEYFYKADASATSVGGFDWNLQFNWHQVPEHERKRRKHAYDPLRSPTMAGGLFSIDKAFFERLGTYDSGFDIWGGENLELSFKTWMCGGTLEILPCSHVGHVFRSRSPYKWRPGVNVLRRNSVRLAEVWMDDYKKYYYDRIGHDLGDYGDVSERLELRKRLNCKPFSYFIKEVYPELFIPGDSIAYGEIRNEAGADKMSMCLDSSARRTDMHKPLGVYPCHGAGGNQYWLLSKQGEIRRDEACVDYAGKEVVLYPCHGGKGNQMWLYDSRTRLLRHSTSGRCMELAIDRTHLKMSDCNARNDAQKWSFQHYNSTLAAISQAASV